MNQLGESLVEFTYKWSRGGEFGDLIQKVNQFEGNVIRMVKRLDELLKQLQSGCKDLSNQQLGELFGRGSASIRRGIIFAASLYL